MATAAAAAASKLPADEATAPSASAQGSKAPGQQQQQQQHAEPTPQQQGKQQAQHAATAALTAPTGSGEVAGSGPSAAVSADKAADKAHAAPLQPPPPHAGAQHRLAAASNSQHQAHDRGAHTQAAVHLNRTKSGANTGGQGSLLGSLLDNAITLKAAPVVARPSGTTPGTHKGVRQ